MKSCVRSSPSKGFTFIEIMIYIPLFIIGVTLLISILEGTVRIQGRENAVVEVTTQSEFVMQSIRRMISESSLIAGASSTLNLRTSASSTDPILVYASSGIIYVDEGSSASIALTTSKVSADYLQFTKFSNPPGKDSVQIDLTLSYVTANPRHNFAKTLRSSIARVSAATFDSDVLPDGSGTRNLGTSGLSWQDGFFTRDVTIGGDLTVDTNTLFVDASGNRVGIGEANPQSALHVASSSYIQIGYTASAPVSTDCDAAAELGRMIFEYTNNHIYICDGTGGWLVSTSTAP